VLIFAEAGVDREHFYCSGDDDAPGRIADRAFEDRSVHLGRSGWRTNE
jgi:hypothetical protein